MGQSRTEPQIDNMLFLLCLLPLCSAVPQYYNYPVNSYPVYPIYQPSYPAQVVPAYPFAGSRVLITHSAFMSVAGTLAKDSASSLTVEGTVEFHQNPATGSNSKYKIYLNGADMANKKYTIGVNSDCTAAGMTLTEVTAPFFLINGFWVTGISDTMNINGADSKTI